MTGTNQSTSSQSSSSPEATIDTLLRYLVERNPSFFNTTPGEKNKNKTKKEEEFAPAKKDSNFSGSHTNEEPLLRESVLENNSLQEIPPENVTLKNAFWSYEEAKASVENKLNNLSPEEIDLRIKNYLESMKAGVTNLGHESQSLVEFKMINLAHIKSKLTNQATIAFSENLGENFNLSIKSENYLVAENVIKLKTENLSDFFKRIEALKSIEDLFNNTEYQSSATNTHKIIEVFVQGYKSGNLKNYTDKPEEAF